MACYHPWYKEDVHGPLPCGQCRGCRSAYAREWAMRCMHEASLYEDNCFLTLTYTPGKEPPGGSLDGPVYEKGKEKAGAFALFMKRLRKEIAPRKVRYFHVGEYGEKHGRPHYHALLFGFDFADKYQWSTRGGFPVFRSGRLESLWTDGFSELGSVTTQSAAYVARYVRKKMTGSWSKQKYGNREPEYGTMSRNPGIGAGWVDKFKCEVFPADSCVVRGSLFKPPRYYAERVGRVDAQLIDEVKYKRLEALKQEDSTPERLAAREAVQVAQENLYTGGEL